MAALILTALVVLCGGLLYYVYDGYLRLLRLLDRFVARPEPAVDPVGAPLPSVAVLIAVCNEAHQIVARIQDVLGQDYPEDLLEVVIASDGSTDDVAAVIAAHFGDGVRLVHAEERVGKTAIQNRAVESVRSSVVLFSDADTRFAAGFLRALVAPFADPAVGAVQAHLLFVPADPSAPMASQGRYWRAELEIRRLEANLGILAVASGACIAVRRELWRPIDPSIGEDCIIPLDVVMQSKTVAYADGAVAHEPADDELEDVVSARVRMTLRNWQGTWSRAALLNPFTHPGYALALWSHKVLRWLSPVWLLGLSLAAFALPVFSSAPLLLLPAISMVAFYAMALVGAVARRRSRRVPVCTAMVTFLLANVGFLGGLVQAARGQRISRYR